MKRALNIIVIVVSAFCVCKSHAQIDSSSFSFVEKGTLGGNFETVFDKEGVSYSIRDLVVGKDRVNESNVIIKATNFPCTNGYFEVWYEDGSGFENATNPTHLLRRNIMCQVLSDVSNFINSPLTTTGEKVRIIVKNINELIPSGSALGLASSFTSSELNLNPSFGLIADNEIWKTIHTGVDSYATFSVVTGNIYHGIMGYNFNGSINWNYDLSTTSLGTNQYDFYSVVLHEIMHALGIASNINYDGTSRAGTEFLNVFTRYDLFLETQSGSKLITNSGPCDLINYAFNANLSPSVTTPGCNLPTNVNSGSSSNSTTCATALKFNGTAVLPIYTPNCFESASSLSHFEDMCFPSISPYGNDNYFAMSNAAQNLIKRYPKAEERLVLCDLGYSVGTSFGTSNNLYSYPGVSLCSGITVAGVHDGVLNSNFTYYGAVGTPITISGFLGNDVNAIGFECLTDITDPSATLNTTAGTSLTNVLLSSNFPGLHLLRYIPINGAQKGNITYIVVYMQTNLNCMPTTCDDLISNGNFETETGCGGLYPDNLFSPNNTVVLSCWRTFSGTPDLISRTDGITCPWGYSSYSFTINPFYETWNGAPNNNYTYLASYEAIQQELTSEIQQNVEYTVTFRAKRDGLALSVPPVLMIRATNGTLTPQISLNLNAGYLLASQSITSFPGWQYYSLNFTYTDTLTLNNLILRSSSFTNQYSGFFIDDITFDLAVNANPLELNLPAAICLNQQIPDMSIYLGSAPPNGYFDGPGVTVSNGICSFNATVAGIGPHEMNYYYTTPSGCEKMIIGYLPVVMNPVIPVFSQATSLCSGALDNLLPMTSDNNIAGSWSPAFNNLTTATYTFTPNAVYCANAITRTINITPSVAPYFNVPTAICQGEFIPPFPTVSANGVQGIWSPTLNLNQTTNYSFMPNAGQCATPLAQTLSVNAQVTPVFSVFPQICSGDFIVPLPQTSMNGINGTWSPSINNTATTNYTFLPASGSCSTIGNATIIVNPPCPECTNIVGTFLTSSLLAGNYQNQTFKVVEDIVISGIVNMNNCILAVTPGKEIRVLSGSMLVLNGCHVYGCVSMWEGIIIEEGGQLRIGTVTSPFKTTLIEDALAAVRVVAHNAQVNNPILTIDGATFNRNRDGIVIDSYPYSDVASKFSIKNSLFTSRIIPYNQYVWTNTIVLKGGNPNATYSNFEAPYINESLYPVSYLKFPNALKYPESGINLMNVGNDPGALALSFPSIIIGSTVLPGDYCVFDNMDVGIYSSTSNFEVVNSTFQFTRLINYGWPYVSVNGTAQGVKCANPNLRQVKVNIAGTSALPNMFYGLNTALFVKDYYCVSFDNNDVRSKRILSANGTNLTGRLGENAVKLFLSKYLIVDIKSNNVRNIDIPISLNQSLTSNSPQININNNLLHKHYLDPSNNTVLTAGYAFFSAILLESQLNGQNGNSSFMNVNLNNIQGARKGITIKNWNNTKTVVNFNNIFLDAYPLFSNVFPVTYGISLFNCIGNGSQLTAITNNYITGFNVRATESKGISIDGSVGNKIECNFLTLTFMGLYFKGNCNPSKTKRNDMWNHRYGFVLDQNAVIGTQGAPGQGADNRWMGSGWTTISNPAVNLSNAKIKSFNINLSLAENSRMFISNVNPTFNPTNSAIYSIGSSPYMTSWSAAQTLTVTNGSMSPCTGIIPNPIEFVYSASENAMVLETTVTPQEADTIEAPYAIRKLHQAYLVLDTRQELLSESYELQDYYDQKTPENVGKLREIERLLDEEDFILGSQKLMLMIPDNLIELAYMDFFELALKYAYGTFDSTDSLALIDLAMGCSFIQGNVIYQANALYNKIYFTSELFDEACPNIVPKSIGIGSKAPKENPFSIEIYPNPNNGEFSIVSQNEDVEKIQLTLYGVDGTLIHSQGENFRGGKINKSVNLAAGTYFVEIVDLISNQKTIEKMIVR